MLMARREVARAVLLSISEASSPKAQEPVVATMM
jgi:hypothetical protein